LILLINKRKFSKLKEKILTGDKAGNALPVKLKGKKRINVRAFDPKAV
jgi:hypothetical protein